MKKGKWKRKRSCRESETEERKVEWRSKLKGRGYDRGRGEKGHSGGWDRKGWSVTGCGGAGRGGAGPWGAIREQVK